MLRLDLLRSGGHRNSLRNYYGGLSPMLLGRRLLLLLRMMSLAVLDRLLMLQRRLTRGRHKILFLHRCAAARGRFLMERRQPRGRRRRRGCSPRPRGLRHVACYYEAARRGVHRFTRLVSSCRCTARGEILGWRGPAARGADSRGRREERGGMEAVSRSEESPPLCGGGDSDRVAPRQAVRHFSTLSPADRCASTKPDGSEPPASPAPASTTDSNRDRVAATRPITLNLTKNSQDKQTYLFTLRTELCLNSRNESAQVWRSQHDFRLSRIIDAPTYTERAGFPTL